MTLNDKHFATASRLAILIFVLTGTVTYLSVREYKQWSALLNTRHLIAYWIVIDRIQEQFEAVGALENLDTSAFLPQDWNTGHSHYYDGFGQVILTQTDNGYQVT